MNQDPRTSTTFASHSESSTGHLACKMKLPFTETLPALMLPGIVSACFTAQALPGTINDTIIAITAANTAVDTLHNAVFSHNQQGQALNALVTDVINKDHQAQAARTPFQRSCPPGQPQAAGPTDPSVSLQLTHADEDLDEVTSLLDNVTLNNSLAASNEAQANMVRCCEMLPALDQAFWNSAMILDIPGIEVLGLSAPRPLVCGDITC
jgi:hypothetical protein